MTEDNRIAERTPFTEDADPQPIYRLIVRARAVLRRSWIVTGLALTLALFAGTCVAVSLTDIAYPLSRALRGTALGLVLVLTLYAFLVGVMKPTFRRLTKAQVARRIERELPDIHNRLVSCIDLSENGSSHPYSLAFFKRLVSEVLEWIYDFHPREIIDKRSLRRAKLSALVAVLLLGLLLGFYPKPVGTALARIFIPSSEIAPYTGVAFTVSPGDVQVLVGDAVTFTASVREGRPETMRLRLTSEAGDESRWYAMQERTPGEWSVTLTGLDDSATYRVHGGGTWSRSFRVTLLERPWLEEARAVVHYPEYMGLSEPRPNPPDTLDVTGPEGGEVEITVRVGGDVSEGALQLLKTRHELAVDPRERVWFDQSLPEATTAERWQWDTERFGRPVHTIAPPELPPEPEPQPEAPDAPEGEPPAEQPAAEQPAEQPAGDAAAPEGQQNAQGADAQGADAQGADAQAADAQAADTPPPAEEPPPPPPPPYSSHAFHSDSVGLTLQPGDSLFAYVFIPPEKPSAALMLQWHDGENWEHRAFWGEDQIDVGQPDTASRRPMGPRPPLGRWVRLEVPASQVGLEGKTLRGMMFTQHGDPVYWGRAGAFQPSDPAPEPYEVASTAPMRSRADGQWTARFPLKDAGYYRVEMRNALGHANKPMQEAKYVALPDNAPEVVLEQPDGDLVVSEPVKVPLVISAYDDFALGDVSLEVQAQGNAHPQSLKSYDPPRRSDTVLGTLDLNALNLKEGEQATCVVLARDKAGQQARSRMFTVRIAADDNAADRLLVRFDESQNAFQEDLLELMVGTGGIQRELEKLSVTYAPLAEEWELIEADSASGELVEELDPETLERLAALRRELDQLAPQVDANAQLAEQVGNQMAQTIQQTEGLQMLPEPVVAVMEALQRAYQDTALGATSDLSELLARAAEQETPDMPDLQTMLRISTNLVHELDSLQAQLKTLREARAAMWEDLDDALADIEGQVFEHQIGITEREMAELQEFLDGVRSDFDELKDKQQDLMASATEKPDDEFADLELEQEKLEKQAEPKLENVRELLDTEALMEQLRETREPEFPEAPYAPETSEYYVPPAEEDAAEPEEEQTEESEEDPQSEENAENVEQPEEEEEEEELPLYLPALRGRRAILDPRFAQMRRPVEKPEADPDGEPEVPREQLRSRQEHLLQELDMADQSLGADSQSLQSIIEQLKQLREPDSEEESPASMARLLRSDSLQQALAMSGRMRMLQARPPAQPGAAGPTDPAPPAARTYRYFDNSRWGLLLRHANADGVETSTRRVILRMQPKAREEILQAMREECPEGYQDFVRSYFRELARLKPAE